MDRLCLSAERDLQHGGAKGGPKRGMHESEGSRLLKGSAKMAPPIHVEDDEQGGGGEPVKKPVGRLLRARLKWKNPHVHGKSSRAILPSPPNPSLQERSIPVAYGLVRGQAAASASCEVADAR